MLPLCTSSPWRRFTPPVLEETQGLVGPDADESLHGERLQGPQGLEDAPDPAGHLSGGVDVVRLGILGEALLEEVERGQETHQSRTGAGKASEYFQTRHAVGSPQAMQLTCDMV